MASVISTGPFWSVPATASDDDASLPDAVDVVIVGAGIVGLTTAALLAESGLQTVVLEAREPGGGTTARSTAKASLLQATRGSEIRRDRGARVFADFLDANVAGLDLVRSRLEGIPAETWSTADAWTYATDATGADRVEREYETLRSLGLDVRLASALELPFHTTGAVTLPDQIQLDPAKYLAHLLEAARSAGATVVWPFRAHKIERSKGLGDNARVAVGFGEGMSIAARWVVLATLLPFPLRSALYAVVDHPSRSYAFAGIGDPMPQGMYISVGEGPTHSLRTARKADGEAVLLVGGHGHPTGQEHPAADHAQQLLDWARKHFSLEPTHAWSAQDYSSDDLLPHVGMSPFGPPGTMIATGFGKWGFTGGSAAAITLHGIITRSEPSWTRSWSPRVVGGPAALRRTLGANVGVAVNLARGWTWDLNPYRAEPEEGSGLVMRMFPRPRATSLVDGRRVTCSAVCTHLGGIVQWNDFEQTWDCPLHGSRFAPDGSVLEGPATKPLARSDDN